MESYIEIEVPLRYDALWLMTLRNACEDNSIPVGWQSGHFHITMAFLEDTPSDVDFATVIDEQLRARLAPTLAFDKLDVFLTMSKDLYIVNLTCANIPKAFENLVCKIRDELEKRGAVMEADFKLHVTLGRIRGITIPQNKIEKVLSSVKLPSFTLRLHRVTYRWF